MNLSLILNPDFCLRLTLTLLHFLWQGVAIALLAFAAAALTRRAPAAARYWILVAALMLMALCPPVTFLSLAPRTASPQLGHALETITSPATGETGPLQFTPRPRHDYRTHGDRRNSAPRSDGTRELFFTEGKSAGLDLARDVPPRLPPGLPQDISSDFS